MAKAVSIQGTVQARRVGEATWLSVTLNDTFCPGDTIRTGERSRAAVLLRDEAVFRLDQQTTVTLSGVEKEKASLIDLLLGAIHFFSRIPRGLKVRTPFVNAGVEGTELLIRVESDQTLLSVFEGQVAAVNEAGSLLLKAGESAMARSGEGPALRIVVRPRDAVQWALYYPPVMDHPALDFPGGAETDWQAMARRSVDRYREGDLAGAFSSLEGAPEEVGDPRFFTYRAALLLAIGRIDQAGGDLDRALELDPTSSQAFALQSIVAVAQNEKDRALDLATRAVELDARSSAAWVALSYAQQARFDLEEALASLLEAVEQAPRDALAWARLAEPWLSFEDLDRALAAAREAVALNPNLARTQTVLGFAYLTQMKTEEAKQSFERAIVMDQADPLQRLGLGLAKIRDGKLRAGRAEIEVAVILDPNNALIRSYLGKAYFEEKRDPLAIDQLARARELDPRDPTP